MDNARRSMLDLNPAVHARPYHSFHELYSLVSRCVRPILTAFFETASTRSLTLIAGAWVGSIWAFVLMFIALFFGAAERDAENRALNTAVMASAYIRQTMTAGEIVLRSMNSLLSENGITDEAAYRRFVPGKNVYALLRDSVGNLQEIDKAAFISTTGEVLNFSFKYPVPAINVADRDYFRSQMDGAAPLTIGIVALDRGSGKWTFYLSQRILDQSGNPMGVAIVGLKADFLANYFVQTTMRDDVAVILQRDDGTVLTGSSIAKDIYGKRFDIGTGSPAATGDQVALGASGPPSIPTVQGGNNYVQAAMNIHGFPARILVLVNEAAFTFRSRLWSIGLIAAGLIGTGLVVLSWRQSLRHIREGLRMSRISSMQAMTSAIAHELNQPLSAISTHLAIVSSIASGRVPANSDLQRDTIEKAQAQLARVGDIIKRLRGFISNGKTDLRDVQLAQLIEASIEFSLVRDRHKDILLDVQVDPDLPPVRADPVQIQQVLVNLIKNSAEAMAGYSGKKIMLTARLANRGMIELVVSDTGPGLSKKLARHLFEPFNTTKTDGMGVGLAICRAIIESHGDTIRSIPQSRGASFAFTLRSNEI